MMISCPGLDEKVVAMLKSQHDLAFRTTAKLFFHFAADIWPSAFRLDVSPIMLASQSPTAPDAIPFPVKRLSKGHGAHFFPVVLFFLLQLMPDLFPDLKRDFFCRPAADVVGFILNPVAQQDADGYPLLFFPQAALRVGLSCSGYDFFCLAGTVFFWLTLRGRERGESLKKFLMILPCVSAAFVMTLLANTSRLCCVAWLSPLALGFIPPHWSGLFHYSVGVLIFMPYLLVATLSCERILHVVRNRSC